MLVYALYIGTFFIENVDLFQRGDYLTKKEKQEM